MNEATTENPDLATRSAVHDLVVEFYQEVVLDDLLGPVFDEAAEVDWASHIPKLVDYWCRILLAEPGTPMRTIPAHRALHQVIPIRPDHCDRWWTLWCRSVDEHWCGPTARRATDHAAALMSGLARHVFGFHWTPPDERDAVAAAVRQAEVAAPSVRRHRSRH